MRTTAAFSGLRAFGPTRRDLAWRALSTPPSSIILAALIRSDDDSSRADVLRWTTDSEDDIALGEALSDKEIIQGWADELVGALADRMTHADIGRLPILDEHRKLVGLVARKDLLRTRARLLPHEHERTAPLRERMLSSG